MMKECHKNFRVPLGALLLLLVMSNSDFGPMIQQIPLSQLNSADKFPKTISGIKAATSSLATSIEVSVSTGDVLIYHINEEFRTSYSTYSEYYRKLVFDAVENTTDAVLLTISEYTNLTTIEICNMTGPEGWTLSRTYSYELWNSSEVLYEFRYLIPLGFNYYPDVLTQNSFLASEYVIERSEFYEYANRFMYNSIQVGGSERTGTVNWFMNFTKEEWDIREYEMTVECSMSYNRANILQSWTNYAKEQTIELWGKPTPREWWTTYSLYYSSVLEPEADKRNAPSYPIVFTLGLFGITWGLLGRKEKSKILIRQQEDQMSRTRLKNRNIMTIQANEKRLRMQTSKTSKTSRT